MITIVSGLPRSGTSLMMQMLVAGGMTPLADGERQADADRALAEELSKVADALAPDARKAFEGRLLEVLRALAEAPDACRDRLDAFRKSDILCWPGWLLSRRFVG